MALRYVQFLRSMYVKLRRYILVSSFVFLASILFGVIVALFAPETAHMALSIVQDSFDSFAKGSSADLFISIFSHNSATAAMLLLLSPVLVFLPIIFLVVNGAFLGLAGLLAGQELGWQFAVGAIAPHGIIEIPAILLLSASGIWMGVGALQRVLSKKRGLTNKIKLAYAFFLLCILPLFLVAAFIESFLTIRVLGI